MVAITFIDDSGNERVVEAKSGETLMEAALSNSVEGISAECGGACACGTCHCFIEQGWREKIPAMAEAEAELIEYGVEGTPDSRLACQVQVAEELNGMVVRLPEDQL